MLTGYKSRSAPSVSLSFVDAQVQISTKHCKIYREGDKKWFLVDGSTNGTYLNAQRVKKNVPVKLSNGDRIMLARSTQSSPNALVEYVFEMVEAAPAPASVSTSHPPRPCSRHAPLAMTARCPSCLTLSWPLPSPCALPWPLERLAPCSLLLSQNNAPPANPTSPEAAAAGSQGSGGKRERAHEVLDNVDTNGAVTPGRKKQRQEGASRSGAAEIGVAAQLERTNQQLRAQLLEEQGRAQELTVRLAAAEAARKADREEAAGRVREAEAQRDVARGAEADARRAAAEAETERDQRAEEGQALAKRVRELEQVGGGGGGAWGWGQRRVGASCTLGGDCPLGQLAQAPSPHDLSFCNKRRSFRRPACQQPPKWTGCVRRWLRRHAPSRRAGKRPRPRGRTPRRSSRPRRLARRSCGV